MYGLLHHRPSTPAVRKVFLDSYLVYAYVILCHCRYSTRTSVYTRYVYSRYVPRIRNNSIRYTSYGG